MFAHFSYGSYIALCAPGVLAAGLSALILWMLLRSGLAWKLATDVPTHRSLHTRATPRVGGWGVTPSIVLCIALYSPQLRWAALAGLLLAAVSQVDDRRGLSARLRFSVQLTASAFICLMYPMPTFWWLLPVLIVGLVWSTNLYNFMDGANGLAGGTAVIGFVTYALAALPWSEPFAGAALAVAGASLGFLFFNFPGARLFLGDAGSIPLGFFAGAFGLIGWSAALWPVWFGPLVFLPFIADATVTLLRRVMRGERFWEAHREHYYQRMIQMDGRHTPTILAWWVLTLAGAGVAMAMLTLWRAHAMAGAAILGALWLVLLSWIGHGVDRRWACFERIDNQ